MEKSLFGWRKGNSFTSYDGLLWEEIKIDNLLCNFMVSLNGNVFVAVGSYFDRYEDGVVFTPWAINGLNL